MKNTILFINQTIEDLLEEQYHSDEQAYYEEMYERETLQLCDLDADVQQWYKECFRETYEQSIMTM